MRDATHFAELTVFMVNPRSAGRPADTALLMFVRS
jgi:hypothetical protein